ncbi:MAG: type II toxin-antitoxin system RelE/ParE family toxin [Chloroflexota bacterium]|nr:type II toxin-antitoxin system RelE/ParE family toxin [Chloroflexota bacterium]
MLGIDIVESATFKRWVGSLRDRRAKARINARLRSLSLGNFGDSSYVGDGIFEMRIHYGPGYRLYYLREGATLVVLLCGGDKGSQGRDIERARRLALDWS